MREIAILIIWLAQLGPFSRVAQTAAEREHVIFRDPFENAADWDFDDRQADGTGSKKRPRLSVRVEHNCLILGTSAAGATLVRRVPRDLTVETKVKVSTIKGSPHDPDPRVPGANIFLRKTETGGMWHAYVVRLWFRDKPNTGVILIRKHAFNLGEGKYVKDQPLFEKRWTLKLDIWYDVRASVVDNQITVWIDGEEIGTATDEADLCPVGSVALSGYSWPSYAFFKDFRVLKPE